MSSLLKLSWYGRGFSLDAVTVWPKHTVLKYSNSSTDSQCGRTNSSNSSWKTTKATSWRLPSFQLWYKKLRKYGNGYVQSQSRVNQKRSKKCSIREPYLFQPNSVLVEMAHPNRTRPWFHNEQKVDFVKQKKLLWIYRQNKCKILENGY